jgi:molybdopterin synthase sulfur carrier subunit
MAAIVRHAPLLKIRLRRKNAAMARIIFTPQLRRFVEIPEVQTSCLTVREGLEDSFAVNPRLRGYVLDDQGHLRANVVIFIDGRRMRELKLLNDPLHAGSVVHVLQALSGG